MFDYYFAFSVFKKSESKGDAETTTESGQITTKAGQTTTESGLTTTESEQITTKAGQTTTGPGALTTMSGAAETTTASTPTTATPETTGTFNHGDYVERIRGTFDIITWVNPSNTQSFLELFEDGYNIYL